VRTIFIVVQLYIIDLPELNRVNLYFLTSIDYTFVIVLVKVYRKKLLIFTIAQDTFFSSCSFSFLFDKI